DLRRSLERGDLLVHYQPRVELGSGRIIGAEALVRWRHRERGLIPPDVFLSLAEETGLITKIDHLVLTEACRQAAMWQARRPGGSPFRMGVNISARGLRSIDLIRQVAEALGSAGLAASGLELEITESVLVEDAEVTVARLGELRAIGVRLAIDDFGTGYSSLGYLRRLPVDTLKIDRSFVADLDADPRMMTIVGAIRTLAHGLGLDVVAEGIETAEQRDRLRDLDVRAGQGYYFAKPMPAAEFEALMAREEAGT
nr:EAL domain-containing protein [Chloroflexota bacterium]